ncbi:uncharacterized protein LOC131998067 [Stomoxys calcitrans]|uniref:uncharacterized protein LOC131998067 n=1 Tax=Stomoxys calcitrans TaxID=35570 RepID=UPI0027E34A7E|nr:uncharacterized protein LOC131998067 [Stomoxys calcitrans]
MQYLQFPTSCNTPQSCTQQSCTQQSCTQQSCTQQSCTQQSCTQQSCTQQSCTRHTYSTLKRQYNIKLPPCEDTCDGLSEVYSKLTAAGTSTPGGAADTSQRGRWKIQKTIEQKREEDYKRSLRYLRKIHGLEPSTLTFRHKHFMRKHWFLVRKHESMMNTTVVERMRPSASSNVSGTDTDANTTTGNVKYATDKTETASGSIACLIPGPEEGKTVKRRPFDDPAAIARKGDQECVPPARVPHSNDKPNSGIKQQRSVDAQAPDGRRAKKLVSLSSAPELQVAILDRSNPEGRLSTIRWLLVEEKILRALSEHIRKGEDDSFVAFDGAKWQKGVKVIGCGNKKALDFLSTCIGGLDPLWPGMKIELVPIDQIPRWTTLRVWIPPPVLEDDAILSLLKGQNKHLLAESWTIVRGRARDKGNGKDLWIRVGSESLSLLKSSLGEVKFGLNHVRMDLPADEDDATQRAMGREMALTWPCSFKNRGYEVTRFVDSDSDEI